MFSALLYTQRLLSHSLVHRWLAQAWISKGADDLVTAATNTHLQRWASKVTKACIYPLLFSKVRLADIILPCLIIKISEIENLLLPYPVFDIRA